MTLAIMAALPEELSGIEALLEGVEEISSAPSPSIARASFRGQSLLLALSGIGKVAAGATAAQLIREYDATEIIFTGVAGSLSAYVNIGDLVVGSQCRQHDLDASPIFPRFQIPSLGLSVISTNQLNNQLLIKAAQSCLGQPSEELLQNQIRLGIEAPNLHFGEIVSGDQFICSQDDVESLHQLCPDALCTEMEGAAVAQVCQMYGCSFSIVRTISDKADEQAHTDFPDFAKSIAGSYALNILKAFLDQKFA